MTTLEAAEALLVPGSAFAAFLERRPRVALVILGRLRPGRHTVTVEIVNPD